MGETPPTLSARGVSYRYRGETPAVAKVDLTIDPGSFTVILGPNGSGKSTLMRLLGGLLRPDEGTVELDGEPMPQIPTRARGRVIAFMAQDEPRHLPWTVFDMVMMGRFPHQGFWPFDAEKDLQAAERALESTDTAAFRGRLISELSGGERQRVHLARALAQEPTILLLDEPASNLDLAHQVDLYRFLRTLNRDRGQSVVAVSHEINLATRDATRVALLKDGKLVEHGPVEDVLTADTLSDVYGVPVRRLRDEESGETFFHPVR